MICTGASNCSREAGHEVRMPVHQRVHGIAQTVLIKQRLNVISSCTAYTSSPLACVMLAWKSSPCCKGVSGKISAISSCGCNSSICCWLGREARNPRASAAPATPDMRADAGQGVEPEPAEPADLRVIKRRGRPRPVGVQLRAGVGVDGTGVEFNGVRQGHGYGRGGAGHRPAVLAETPHVSGRRPPGIPAPQIVEPDRRVRPG